MSEWEYRIVRNKEYEAEFGEVLYELKEVYYDDSDRPWAFGDPCLMSDTPEGFATVMGWVASGAAKPVLVYPDDFDGVSPAYGVEDEEDDNG